MVSWSREKKDIELKWKLRGIKEKEKYLNNSKKANVAQWESKGIDIVQIVCYFTRINKHGIDSYKERWIQSLLTHTKSPRYTSSRLYCIVLDGSLPLQRGQREPSKSLETEKINIDNLFKEMEWGSFIINVDI